MAILKKTGLIGANKAMTFSGITHRDQSAQRETADDTGQASVLTLNFERQTRLVRLAC